MIGFINVSLAAVASRARTLGTKGCGRKRCASFFDGSGRLWRGRHTV
jgi:hypothetical protein